MNQPASSEVILEKLLASEKTTPHIKAPFSIALIYAALNKPDKMYTYLHKSIENRDNSVIYILGNTYFTKYRSDPRFTEVLQRIGIWN
jgi:hypothetical protein